MKTRGLWLTPSRDADREDGSCAGWLSEPSVAAGNPDGVLILPPIGYESSSSHRLWRTLAETLAYRGFRSLRLDYWGTGDSAGSARDVTSLETWRASIRSAVDYLRGSGCQHVVVVACQLGVLLADMEASSMAFDGLVAVAPTRSGRRFVRGASVIALRAPDDVGGIAIGGHHLTREVLAELTDASVSVPAEIPHLEIGANRVASVLQRSAESAEVPLDVVDEIADWISALQFPAVNTGAVLEPSLVRASSSVELLHDGHAITEDFVVLGAAGFIGVRTRPTGASMPPEKIYVLVNSGSDPHVGPGRAWVELARYLATLGFSTLRVDFRGWGESPDGPSMPARPYADHCVDDAVSIVKALHEEGTTGVVLGGLCAGAWISLHVATHVAVTGCVVLNPQLYWYPGEPWEALVSETRARRAQEVAAIKADARAGRWDAEDIAGIRPPGGVLLDELVASGTTTSLVFTEDDDGIEYLRDRLARRLEEVVSTGRVRITEVPDVDHGMQRAWRRADVFAAISHELNCLFGNG